MSQEPRETIVHPVGQVTQPNKFGWYVDGSLEHAINCVMRNPGELGAAPGMFTPSNAGNIDYTVKKLFALDAGHVYTWVVLNAFGLWAVNENVSGAFNAATPGFPYAPGFLYSPTGRIFPVRAKDRMFVNSRGGVQVGNTMAPTTTPERTLRSAGMVQPNIRTAIPFGGGGTLPANVNVNYCVIATRTYADGYKIVSVPSPYVQISTGSGLSDGFLIVSVPLGFMLAGDVYELYRSDGISNLTQTLTNVPDPGATMKLVGSHTLTSTDIAAQSYSFTDVNVMGDAPTYVTSGRELYSNPFFGGSTNVNRQPPTSQCLANYDGRVFYGNTSERPKLTFTVPGGVGSSANVALQTTYWLTNGIGTRTGAGTITGGSANITGVAAGLFVGLKPGQRWNGGAAFAGSPEIIALNAGTGVITLSANAAGAGAAWSVTDVLEINGIRYTFGSYGGLLLVLANQQLFEVTADRAVNMITSSSAYVTGLELNIEPIHPSSFIFSNNVNGPQTMDIRATNGANYNPPIPEMYTTYPVQSTPTTLSQIVRKNRVTWSKDQQPEHVNPGANENFVGLREIIAMASTREAVWFACLDGTFRMTGINGQYRFDQVDSTNIICAPQCMTALNEDVYVYTNFGMIQMNSESRQNLTDQIIGDQLVGPEFLETSDRILQANENDLEIVYRDNLSANKLWIYATREGGGWTTLENNDAQLSNITALAYQRNPASGDPKLLVGVSPLAAIACTWSGWGNTAAYLVMDFQFQPVYDKDPLGLKQWLEGSFIFDAGNTGKTLVPIWNSTPIGSAKIVQYQNAAYARAGVPRANSISATLAAGAKTITAGSVQPRFLGLSLQYLPLGNQAKGRGT